MRAMWHDVCELCVLSAYHVRMLFVSCVVMLNDLWLDGMTNFPQAKVS